MNIVKFPHLLVNGRLSNTVRFNVGLLPYSVRLRSFHVNYSLQNKNLDTPKLGSTNSAIKNSDINNVKKKNDLIEKFDQLKKQVNITTKQFLTHFNIAKVSLKEANKRFLEQEKAALDSKLNYSKNVLDNTNIKDLPSDRELHRKKWKRKLEFYLDSLQETIFTATKALNDVTGYSSIQKLRNSIIEMEKQLDALKKELKLTKNQYSDAVDNKVKSQKILNELLQRKNTWSPSDLEVFTKIYKEDAANMKQEDDLKKEVQLLEHEQEKLSDDLYRAILTRYHEEQIWSDKIRRTSTWGTFILMGFNILLFTVFQLILEPWKRHRLTRSFEDKVKLALESYKMEEEADKADLDNHVLEEKKIDVPVVLEESGTDDPQQLGTIEPPSKYDNPNSLAEYAQFHYSKVVNIIKGFINNVKLINIRDSKETIVFTTLNIYIGVSLSFLTGICVASIVNNL